MIDTLDPKHLATKPRFLYTNKPSDRLRELGYPRDQDFDFELMDIATKMTAENILGRIRGDDVARAKGALCRRASRRKRRRLRR